MTFVRVTIGDETTLIAISSNGDEGTADTDTAKADAVGAVWPYVIPRGMLSLQRAHITADPPPPQDLTNAIADMMDHLDDAVRELPELATAAGVILAGSAAQVIAAVEVGGTVPTPTFSLTRDAAEDVFRTLATEPALQRRHNPGLPTEHVDTIVGGCCAVVALFRSLHLETATVDVSAATEPDRHRAHE